MLFVLAIIAIALHVRRGNIRFPVGPGAGILVLGTFLAGLGLASTSWSGDPRQTFHRAAAFALVLGTVAALGTAASDDPRIGRAALVGIVVSVGILNAAGLLLLLVHAHEAAQSASTSSPWRFRGIGENPDTVSMLAGITMPLAIWLALSARDRAGRLAWSACIVLSYAAITLSGSRGALAAAVAGSLAMSACLYVVRRDLRPALKLAGVVILLGVSSLGLSRVPSPATTVAGANTSSSTTSGKTGVETQPVPSGASIDHPDGLLTDEVGLPQHGRPLLSSSGRVQAWSGAIDLGNERPLLGYGFGTESDVFFDHYQVFESDLVENSYIGMYLQLGMVGLLALVGLLGLVALVAVRGVRSVSPDAPLPALVGVLCAGAVVMVVQSFVYSPGDLSVLPFWLCVGIGAVEGVHVPRPARRSSWLARRRNVLGAAGLAIVLVGAAVPVAIWQKHRAIASTGRQMEQLASVPGPKFTSHLSGARIARGFDCLIYAAAGNPFGLEFCFSGDGHLGEAIDRRGSGVPRFLSLRYEPEASPVHPPVAVLLRVFHRVRFFLATPLSADRLPISGTDYSPVMLARRGT